MRAAFIVAQRKDYREGDIVVLNRLTPYELESGRDKYNRPISYLLEEHGKETNINGAPVYDKVWLLEFDIPEKS